VPLTLAMLMVTSSARNWPALVTVRFTGASSPGLTSPVSELSRIRIAFFWMPIAVSTLTGIGYFVLLPPSVSIQTSGKYIPLLSGDSIEKVMGIDWPGPISPTWEKSFVRTSIPLPSRWTFWILTLMSVVFTVWKVFVVIGPELSLTEALDAVFSIVMVIVPRVSGMSTEGLTL